MFCVTGIVVLPRLPSALDSTARIWTRPIGGLPLLLRQARLLKEAGCEKVHILGDAKDETVISAVQSGSLGLKEVCFLIRSQSKHSRKGSTKRSLVIVMSGDWLFSGRAIARAIEMARRTDKVHVFTRENGTVGLAAAPDARLNQAIESLEGHRNSSHSARNQRVIRLRADDLIAIINDEQSLANAERHLWENCRKTQDGLISRYLNRHISLAISRKLVDYAISPNQISIGNLILGLMAGLLASFGNYWSVLGGAVLFQANSILDGVDGELARIRLQSSVLGEWLDTLTDDITNVFFFAALGFGAWRETGNELWILVASACSGTMVAVSLTYYSQLIRMKRGDVLAIGWFQEKWWQRSETNAVRRRLIAFGTTVFRKDMLVFAILVAAVFGTAHHLVVIALVSAWIVLLAQIGSALTGFMRQGTLER